MTKKNPPTDMYRGSNVRYLGYAHVIATALRPLVGYLSMNIAYAVSVTYICADLFDKVSKKSNDPAGMNKTAGDVLLWHSMATLFFPKLVVGKLASFTCVSLRKAHQSRDIVRIVPCIVGLLAIPIIIKPIDAVTDLIMDNTYREWTAEGKKS